MKTVSTKLDNNLHSRFIEICNEDGKCQSEFLRDLIETVCEDLNEGDTPSQDLEMEHTPRVNGVIIKGIGSDGTEYETRELKNPSVEINYDE